jgi:DNA-directed RNA polymerase specialized sigma24 family protein
MSVPIDETRRRVLGSAEIRRALTDFVRKRVAPSDVDDVVQMVLLDALASTTAPENREELRKWLMGVARNKIADLHRKGSRERPAELPEIEVSPPPVEEQELVRWAEREAGKSSKDGVKTLAWMAREGEGDKLEHIAAEEQLPAATVRQRVSRMRRFMRERWLAEVAAVALLGGLGFLLYRTFSTPDPIAEKEPQIVEEPRSAEPMPVEPSRLERAARLRQTGLQACADGDFNSCEKSLDEAQRLDPSGENSPEVRAARDTLQKRTVVPSSSAAPVPAPSSSVAPLAVPSSTAAIPKSTSFTPLSKPTAKPMETSPSKAPGKPKASPKMPSSFGSDFNSTK